MKHSSSDLEKKSISEHLHDRLTFMQITEEECASIRSIKPLIDRHLPEALECFYKQIRKTPAVHVFFKEPAILQKAQKRQYRHWENISNAHFTEEYYENVRKIGKIHAYIGLTPRWYIEGYSLILNHLLIALIGELSPKHTPLSMIKKTISPLEVGKIIGSLCKAVFLDMDLAISVYQEEEEKQRKALIESEQNRVKDSFGTVFNRLAQGDFTLLLQEEDMPQNYHNLRDNLNTTILAIKETLSIFKDSVSEINLRSSYITQSQENLVENIEENSKSTQEIARDIDNITKNVTTTTHHIEEVHEFSNECAEITNHFVTLIEDATKRMENIQQTSFAITEITETLNHIAQQTNLLALNTGIEAAHMRQEGNAFQILAKNIRELSLHAEQAAQNVRNLISETQQEALKGNDIIHQAKDSVHHVTKNITKMQHNLENLSHSAGKQTETLHKINHDIRLMVENMTKSTHIVSDTKQSSDTMHEETLTLNSKLNSFKLT